MASKYKREIVWLCLPLLFIGSVAWLRSNTSSRALRIENPFASGPMRVDFTPIQPLPLEPIDVADGYDWKGQTDVQVRGTWDVPKNWKDGGAGNLGVTRNLRLVYRRGRIWSEAKPAEKGKSLITSSIGQHHTFKVNLKTIPRDVNEVRLRGEFERIQAYTGPLPANWNPPKELRTLGPNQLLTLRSKPFDIQIKGEDESMPSPVVSQEPQIEIVDGKWLTEVDVVNEDWRRDVFVLQLRRKDGDYFSSPSQLWGRNLKLFDANNKQLVLYDDWGKEREILFWHNHRFEFSPNSPKRDVFAVFCTGQFQPIGRWINAEVPLRLRGEIGDGGSWPQKIDVKIAHLLMKREDFGAAE
ncbi:MAG: hypothetical protein EOP04_22400 [Proteobacteria bacterium]|nr:MAG: hypothetical protein EOP04_22400 [Pseudomonadota bacterium]